MLLFYKLANLCNVIGITFKLFEQKHIIKKHTDASPLMLQSDSTWSLEFEQFYEMAYLYAFFYVVYKNVRLQGKKAFTLTLTSLERKQILLKFMNEITK